MILFVVPDTTGFPNFKLEVDDPAQPHLVRLAVIAELDGEVNEKFVCLVELLDRVSIEPGAARSHGITEAMLQHQGQPLADVIYQLDLLAMRAEAVVVFGENFQRRVLTRACHLAGYDWEPKAYFDCCVEATPILKKPRMAPGGGYAPPSFADCYRFFEHADLPNFATMEPIAGGMAKVEALRAIYRGIMAARAGG